ncbi:MAG: fumarylacetoacetate hydrolase family protein [Acidipila sp.]|nr:fumarylacetoacetate hydrolase family protein [Acidipila sp.]
MRLVTFENAGPTAGSVRLGLVVGTAVIDLAARSKNAGQVVPYFSSMAAFLDAGDEAMSAARAIATDAGPGLRLEAVRLLPPVPRPGKIIAVGFNYRDHAAEQGIKPPEAPLIFAKFTTSITGPYDPIVLPAGDPQVDYEAELGVVIGRRGKSIPEDRAYDYIAGYLALNDVSARKWQFGDKQWVRGKSCDTFCPIGPWLVTRDEVPDPQGLQIACRVNGEVRQSANTRDLYFGISTLLAYISASITLEPGDIIATGTPPGVGVFRKPPIYLQAGDVVEVEIASVGTLRNAVVAA